MNENQSNNNCLNMVSIMLDCTLGFKVKANLRGKIRTDPLQRPSYGFHTQQPTINSDLKWPLNEIHPEADVLVICRRLFQYAFGVCGATNSVCAKKDRVL